MVPKHSPGMVYNRPRPSLSLSMPVRYEEPRHSPTRVELFSSPAGDRVCSITGGRTCSAATTADGRLFKWGLNSKGSNSCAGEYSGEESSCDLNEERGSAALENSTPHQVGGVGIAVSSIWSASLYDKILAVKARTYNACRVQLMNQSFPTKGRLLLFLAVLMSRSKPSTNQRKTAAFW